MTYQDLMRKYEHSGKVLICCPHWRDVKTCRVVSWLLVTAVDSVEAARGVLERLDLEEAVAIPTHESITLPDDLSALFFRVFLGME